MAYVYQKLLTPANEDIMWNKTSDHLVADYTTEYSKNVTTSSTLHNVTGNLSVHKGCHVVRFEEMEFLPWDNPDNIVSAQVPDIAGSVKDNLLPILFLIGWPSNVINMAVFYKQGLKDRVNVCLFSLALADGLSLVYAMFLQGEQLHLQFTTKEMYGPVMRVMVNNNLVGFYGFAWGSMVISAIIASERCYCVLSPLRYQTLLKTRTMAAIIAAVYLVVVGFYFLVATRYRIGCVVDPASNAMRYTVVPSVFYLNHERFISYLDSFVYGAGIPGVMIIVVTTTTIITAMKIRQAAEWRGRTSSASGSSSSSSSSSMSPREIALTKMLIGNSVLFIVCVSPLALFRVAWLFLPDMNVGGRHQNLFLAGLWFLEPLAYVNWSCNIFVYYIMGSRFREVFWALFRKKTVDKEEENSSLTRRTGI